MIRRSLRLRPPPREELANFLLFERGLVIKPVLITKSEDTQESA